MTRWTTTELMACVIARDLVDGEVVVMGAVPALPMAACLLARATHAPNLDFIVGGSGTVSPAPDRLPASSCTGELAPAEVTLPLPDVVSLEGRGDAFDVFCAGGLQIDAHGNCNLVAVGDWERPKLRGPGTVGLPFLPNTKRSIIYTQSHTPRTFVERVDFVSGPGHPSGPDEARPYRKQGPSLVVTPLASFDFDETGRMRLRTVHPGVTVDEVLAATGFEPAPGPDPSTTPEPTEEELAILRDLDRDGVLRR
ncbi:MAG TPA: CoA synthetase [Actinobacteria bacterium]|nr:CoA synthetase [Actinomycetota bacterium]